MKLVLPRTIADEGVVVTAQLANHVAQREYGSEDELSVVGGTGASARGWPLGG